MDETKKTSSMRSLSSKENTFSNPSSSRKPKISSKGSTKSKRTKELTHKKQGPGETLRYIICRHTPHIYPFTSQSK